MRLFASTIVVLTAVSLLGLGSPTSAHAADTGVCQASDAPACDAGTQQQDPAACSSEPGVAATLFDRFVNPRECEPHWGFTADAVVLKRLNPRDTILFYSPVAPTEVLGADRLNSDAAIGFQLGAVRHGPCGWDIELGYFQIDGWNGNRSVPGDSLMMTGASGYFVTNAETQYKSSIHLAEINVRRQWFEGFSILAGFRAGEVNEIYGASGLDTTALTTDSLETKAFNHLYGFQLGAEWEFYNRGGPLRISALCKSGLYDNAASQTSTTTDATQGVLSVNAHRNQTAFMGEASIITSYDVTRHLTFRALCQAMWIEGIALAPEQVLDNDFGGQGTTLNTHGGIFAYGGGLGVEYKF
jgi:hypothetical protein